MTSGAQTPVAVSAAKQETLGPRCCYRL